MDTSIHLTDIGYWGKHTATRDWCEVNYAHSRFIAEFWNTISNVLYVLAAGNVLYHKWKLREVPNWPKSLNISIGGLACLGIASGSFHATLKYWPQFFDRIFCIWPLIGIEMGFNEFEREIGFSMFSLMYYLATSAIAFFLIFEIWCFYLAVHSMYRGYLIVIQNDIDAIKFHGKKTIAMIVLAVSLWGLDMVTCDFLSGYGLSLHFHCMWHVLTAAAFHETALIQIFLFLRKEKMRPTFVTWKMLNIGVDSHMKQATI